MSSDGKGFRLPDDISCSDEICVKVTVPNNLEYRAAFWGSLWKLTKWWCWERDDEKRGKDAAARIKQCIEESYAAYLAGERCGVGLFDVRQNEDEPCKLEKTLDGGENWVEFCDLTLCTKKTAKYIYDETLPDGREPDTGYFDDIMRWLWLLLDTIDALADASTPTIEIKTQIVNQIVTDTGLYMPAEVGDLVDTYVAATSQERKDAKTSVVWEQIRDDTICEGREISLGPQDDHEGWLEAVGEALVHALEVTGDALVGALLDVTELLFGDYPGVNRAGYSVYGAGDDFGWDEPVCTGTYQTLLWDFDTQPHPYGLLRGLDCVDGYEGNGLCDEKWYDGSKWHYSLINVLLPVNGTVDRIMTNAYFFLPNANPDMSFKLELLDAGQQVWFAEYDLSKAEDYWHHIAFDVPPTTLVTNGYVRVQFGGRTSYLDTSGWVHRLDNLQVRGYELSSHSM